MPWLAVGAVVIGATVTAVVVFPAPAPVPSRPGFFENLFTVYTPRRVCMFHEPGVTRLHFVADLLIGIAYFSIPVALTYFVRKRRDLAFHWIYWLFAAFILACGTTHFVGVWDLWQPMYKIDGLVKALTAAVSLVTAVLLWKLIPKALALPTPALLEQRVTERTMELAKSNDALRAARNDAEMANRIKEEFLATLSHELRTPLQAILGWARVLQESKSPAEIADGLQVITRNANAQKKLIEDLLDVGRIAAGKLTIEHRTVDFADVVSAAIATVRPAVELKDLRLDASVAQVTVLGDAARLQQVVLNLLSNAVKFTPRGGHVSVTVTASEKQVTLVVQDSGDGFPADFAPRLFERFAQADSSSSRRHGGLGIGLALVKHVVELHGGSVHARSDGRGKGATFVTVLPRLHAAMADVVPAEPRQASVRGLAGVRVLVVEDDADARDLTERALRGAGATVTTAGSLAEAMERLAAQAPDLVLCDLGLPGEDGFVLLQRIRSLPETWAASVPVVALTAFASSEDRAHCLRAGFQAHVAKPFDPDELVGVLARLLGRRPS